MGTEELCAEVEQLLAEAAGLSPAARALFLENACAGRPAVRARVEELLRETIGTTPQPRWATTQTGSLIWGTAPVRAAAGGTHRGAPFAERIAWMPGDVLFGRYEVQEVRRGGMACAYICRT